MYTLPDKDHSKDVLQRLLGRNNPGLRLLTN